jgi:predicted RNA-binding Zn-ribbon protein involved in translation (DUF1610 family)
MTEPAPVEPEPQADLCPKCGLITLTVVPECCEVAMHARCISCGHETAAGGR